MNFDSGMFGGGLSSLVGGLFGDSGRPYDNASREYQQWVNRAQQAQQPYADAGTGGIKNYQDWLQQQKDPTAFINKIMGGYSESPYAHYLQQQSQNAGINAASASGLTGSTPFAQSLQQNAHDISSQDQNQWLQNVLGINTQYGEGQHNLMNSGQNSANNLTNLYNNAGQNFAGYRYGQEAGRQQDRNNMIGGALGLGLAFL